MDFSIPTPDPRPPCIGELTKGCSMGNTEVLVDAMAQKIAVLKHRLSEAERTPDHAASCKLDCLMAMLPLLLGGSRAAAVAPAVTGPAAPVPPDTSRLHERISHLEADKAELKIKIEKLKAEKAILKSQCAELETAKAEKPTVSFENIFSETFGGAPEPPVTPSSTDADLRAQLAKVTAQRDAALALLDEKKGVLEEENARLKQSMSQAVSMADYTTLKTECEKVNTKLAECVDVRDNCIEQIGGEAPHAVVAPAPIAPTLPDTGGIIMEDNPILGQGTCDLLTDAQRSYRVRKWNITPDPITGKKIPGQTLRSVSSIVSTPITLPPLGDVGSRFNPVPANDRLEIQQQLGGLVTRLKEVYQIMRPGIWTGANCGDLQAQYVNDVKTMLSRLACQLVNAINQKALANNVSDQVTISIPDALKSCEETLETRIASLTPGTTAQNAGAAMVSALETLFNNWMINVDATDASGTIIHGIFCPILSKIDACTWPTDVSGSQALGAVWNKK